MKECAVTVPYELRIYRGSEILSKVLSHSLVFDFRGSGARQLKSRTTAPPAANIQARNHLALDLPQP